jgi:hypothetical protein
MADIESEKLAIERERLQQEASLRQEELAIRRAELTARIEDEQKKRIIKFSPAVTGAILIAVVGLFGNLITQVSQGVSSIFLERRRLDSDITLEQRKLESEIALEREKFESSLILKALEGKSPQESAENLRFLVEVGLLESRKDRLAALVAQPERIPTFEPIESRLARMEIQLSAFQCEAAGKVFDVSLLRCTNAPLK